ncbi:hypothetical protein [Haloarchaeobius amylolyticus]|uniref:hypothetical protein n=1 Tax=Haloarchaeobius amylolyticus TaxID=1198296 RepID=UPI00226E6D6E|nr:hypothetical protein [Haloarchaeobius amylolyticus]
MGTIDSLPSRPLTGEEVQSLAEQDAELTVVPGNYVPEIDRVYALFFIYSGKGHAVGFEPEAEEWTIVETVDEGTENGFTVLQQAIAEWGQDTYDDDFLQGGTTVDFDDEEAVVEDIEEL